MENMQSAEKIPCYKCGACCTAYSVSTLNKAAGERCVHLYSDGANGVQCGDYENRPPVCRSVQPDYLCKFISTLSFDEKVTILIKVYME